MVLTGRTTTRWRWGSLKKVHQLFIYNSFLYTQTTVDRYIDLKINRERNICCKVFIYIYICLYQNPIKNIRVAHWPTKPDIYLRSQTKQHWTSESSALRRSSLQRSSWYGRGWRVGNLNNLGSGWLKSLCASPTIIPQLPSSLSSITAESFPTLASGLVFFNPVVQKVGGINTCCISDWKSFVNCHSVTISIHTSLAASKQKQVTIYR